MLSFVFSIIFLYFLFYFWNKYKKLWYLSLILWDIEAYMWSHGRVKNFASSFLLLKYVVSIIWTNRSMDRNLSFIMLISYIVLTCPYLDGDRTYRLSFGLSWIFTSKPFYECQIMTWLLSNNSVLLLKYLLKHATILENHITFFFPFFFLTLVIKKSWSKSII